MSGSPPKTVGTVAVEGFLANALGGFISHAAAQNPPPPLAEANETISPTSILNQLRKHIETDDHISAARLALILASWLARGEDLTFGEASKLAGLSWTQTSGLPRPPKLR